MRAIIDIILVFIGTSTLTNNEFTSISLEEGYTDENLYDAILEVLTERTSSNETKERLWYYFRASGSVFAIKAKPHSNILLGGGVNAI